MRRGVGEEHQQQGELGEGVDHVLADMELEESGLGHQQAEGDEDDRRRQHAGLDPFRDQPETEDSDRDDDEGETLHGWLLCRLRLNRDGARRLYLSVRSLGCGRDPSGLRAHSSGSRSGTGDT